MDSKSVFLNMMNVANDDEDGMESMRNMFGELFGDNFDLAALVKKPEVQRLFASDELREAIQVAEIPALSALYNQMSANIVADRSYNLGMTGTYLLMFVLPIALLLVVFVYLAFKILKSWREKEITREDKKRLRQLKKENAEAQRRLQLAKGQKKKD